MENGADPLLGDLLGNSALHIATEFIRIEEMKLLLQKRAGIDFEDNQGRTALNIAASKGSLEAVKVLLENGANPDFRVTIPDKDATLIKDQRLEIKSPQSNSRSLVKSDLRKSCDTRRPSLHTILETELPFQTYDSPLTMGASSSRSPSPFLNYRTSKIEEARRLCSPLKDDKGSANKGESRT